MLDLYHHVQNHCGSNLSPWYFGYKQICSVDSAAVMILNANGIFQEDAIFARSIVLYVWKAFDTLSHTAIWSGLQPLPLIKFLGNVILVSIQDHRRYTKSRWKVSTSLNKSQSPAQGKFGGLYCYNCSKSDVTDEVLYRHKDQYIWRCHNCRNSGIVEIGTVINSYR